MIPEKIGKYTVIELLGRGGMGEVYLGEDPYIGRRVAIKMIKGADPDARDRFLHEARVIGGLAHPAIVSLIDFDFSGDEPFLVMELLKGQGLDTWIRQAHTLREKLVILDDVCQALAFAHENGVLHRDVKPSNVQVLPNGHAKLMDFGIARGGAARLTATGAVMGTPEYMAPEILRDASYSAKSDLYACSVLLYEMFTGENPFAAKTVAATLTNVLTHTPKDLGSVRADIPEALSAAVMRCLEKEPEARPEGFEELLGAGRAALAAPVPTLAETRAIPLERTAGGSLGETRAVPGQTSGSRRWLWPVLVVAAAFAGWWALRPSPPPADSPLATQASAPSPSPAEVIEPPAVSASIETTPTPDEARAAAPAKLPSDGVSRRAMPSPTPAAVTREPLEPLTAAATGRAEPSPAPVAAATPFSAATPESRAPVAPLVAKEPPPSARPSPVPETAAPVNLPSVSSVSPRSIRRGSSVVLELRGSGLRPDMEVRILQGRRPAVGIRVVRVEYVSPVVLRVTVLSEAELPLGGYTLLLQDAAGLAIPGLQIEVVL